jgi:hypothetical protein
MRKRSLRDWGFREACGREEFRGGRRGEHLYEFNALKLVSISDSCASTERKKSSQGLLGSMWRWRSVSSEKVVQEVHCLYLEKSLHNRGIEWDYSRVIHVLGFMSLYVILIPVYHGRSESNCCCRISPISFVWKFSDSVKNALRDGAQTSSVWISVGRIRDGLVLLSGLHRQFPLQEVFGSAL